MPVAPTQGAAGGRTGASPRPGPATLRTGYREPVVCGSQGDGGRPPPRSCIGGISSSRRYVRCDRYDCPSVRPQPLTCHDKDRPSARLDTNRDAVRRTVCRRGCHSSVSKTADQIGAPRRWCRSARGYTRPGRPQFGPCVGIDARIVRYGDSSPWQTADNFVGYLLS
jgi:hypothetical protein